MPAATWVDLQAALEQLDAAGLAAVQERIEDLLGGEGETGASSPPPNGTGQGWIEIKRINGHRYKYRRWYDGGVKRSQYIGKAE